MFVTQSRYNYTLRLLALCTTILNENSCYKQILQYLYAILTILFFRTVFGPFHLFRCMDMDFFIPQIA